MVNWRFYRKVIAIPVLLAGLWVADWQWNSAREFYDEVNKSSFIVPGAATGRMYIAFAILAIVVSVGIAAWIWPWKRPVASRVASGRHRSSRARKA